ncbi:S-adenosyl-L-methionine-dependent methyltransferase [Phycomyces nitens]|nr:S-adenosyl-L-methionine-dependent methyltransferase [Phycomyces nitens]
MASKDNWSSDLYSTNASFVPKLGAIILNMLDPKPTEHILDLGCGDGILTASLGDKCASVVGVDYSSDMINRAVRDNKHDNIRYDVVDGHYLSEWFDQSNQSAFDAVFSNAALHWLKEPVKVIHGMHHVLKPKGRIVLEFGGFMNVGEIHTALITALNRRGFNGQSLSPWFFPSAEYYSELLQQNGFEVASCTPVPRITELDTDIKGWLNTFGFTFFEVLTAQEKDKVIDEVVEHLRPGYQREDGRWCVMYVRLRVIAYKK